MNILIVFLKRKQFIFKGSEKYHKKNIFNKKLSLLSNEEKIKRIGKLTLLDEMIENKKIDYNYLISEFSSNLSGGEKKKIILTRALLKSSDILILDEVFNEISIKEEFTILTNILREYKDKIIIVISHRNNNIHLFNKKYLVKGDGINEIKW